MVSNVYDFFNQLALTALKQGLSDRVVVCALDQCDYDTLHSAIAAESNILLKDIVRDKGEHAWGESLRNQLNPCEYMAIRYHGSRIFIYTDIIPIKIGALLESADTFLDFNAMRADIKQIEIDFLARHH